MRTAALLLALSACVSTPSLLDQERTSFFLTSTGPGNGGDLGGLAGADAHCAALAEAAGIDGGVWHAYLSATASGGRAAVHARDRIGTGPWYNARGVMIARDVDHLHDEDNGLGKETFLDERGRIVNGAGDTPNMHDILTGSDTDGTLFVGEEGAMTCSNWTSSDEGRARVGHHDGQGGRSWNSTHNSRGCSQEVLQATGGNGLFYCFDSSSGSPSAPDPPR